MASIPVRSLACVKRCGLPPRVFCCGAAVTEHPGGSAPKDSITNPEVPEGNDLEIPNGCSYMLL